MNPNIIYQLLPPPSEGDHQLFRNIVKIDLTFGSPRDSSKHSCSVSGFTINIKNKTWVVTNRHCLDVGFGDLKMKGLVLGSILFNFPGATGQTQFNTYTCDLDKINFLYSETSDLAAISMDDLEVVNGGYSTANIYEELIATNNLFEAIHVGSQILFIGYPAKLWDQQNNLPILRTASISSIPKYNYSIENQNKEPRVLVDGMSIGGSSGSPVFYQTDRLRLLGIMSGHYFDNGTSNWTTSLKDDIDAKSQKNHTGLSYFIKASELKNISAWKPFGRHGS